MALSSFVGREREVAAVRDLLVEARLVTLTGAGGVGKTRLALAVVGELLGDYPDGVWLVELASLADPALVTGSVAQALGVREEPGRPLSAILADHLRDKRPLLVLDNCEHLVAACAQLASALLQACPELRILATSREGLEVQGERHWRVPSLSVPDPRHLPPPELAGSYEAVRLFMARAQERRPDFALKARNARTVASICARLDGIPLAIELAAARVDSLSVEGIAARLDDRFRLLTGGARDALPRQHTLRATMDWSYDLLSEGEQRLLGRLAVFAGGWTLAAAEAVCAGAGEGIAEWEVLDLLGGLVRKSLAQTEERGGGELRYGLLETVRQYGQERLAAAGDEERVRDRHLKWYLSLAEIAGTLNNLGNATCALGEYERAAALHEEALALRRELGDQWGIAASLGSLANLARAQGEHGRATALYQESLRLGRDTGARDLVATGLEYLAWEAAAGKCPRAARLGGAAEALRQTLGTPLPPALRAGHDGAVWDMRTALGEDAFAAAWAQGRALTPDEAVALALDPDIAGG